MELRKQFTTMHYCFNDDEIVAALDELANKMGR